MTISNTFKTALAATAVTTSILAAGTGGAQASDRYKLWIWNHTPGAIWVTVYTLLGQNGKKDWFCVLPDQMKQSNKDFGAWPNVYIRAEIKRERDGCGNSKNARDSKNHYMEVDQSGRSMMTFTSSKVTDEPSIDKRWK